MMSNTFILFSLLALFGLPILVVILVISIGSILYYRNFIPARDKSPAKLIVTLSPLTGFILMVGAVFVIYQTRYSPAAEQRLFELAQYQIAEGRFRDAAETDETILNRFPLSNLTERVMFGRAEAYEQLAALQRQSGFLDPKAESLVQEAYQAFLDFQIELQQKIAKDDREVKNIPPPDSALTAEASWRIAQCLERQGEKLQARDAYQDFLAHYPDSVHATVARAILASATISHATP